MDYDPTKINNQTLLYNSNLNKTSLILPPLSVGNMQKTISNIESYNSKFYILFDRN